MTGLRPSHWLVFVLSLVVASMSLWRLEGARAGIGITGITVGATPATIYRPANGGGRLAVLSHGFAGSRQLMEAYALTLARSGLTVLSFDYEGHGRNTVPMSGDATRIAGTTQRLVDQTRRVIDAGLALPGVSGPVALVGHSMATDVIVRTAAADPRVSEVVAISMYSEAVTGGIPNRLLMITGEWEPHLRRAAIRAMAMVVPGSGEGDTVESGGVVRRAIVAPRVEHVGVLYSPAGLAAARDWLGGAPVPVAATGPAILGLLAALVAMAWPLSRLLPDTPRRMADLPAGRFALALVLPALAAPLIATRFETGLLPVLVADYLMVHLGLLGLGQLILLRLFGAAPGRLRPVALAALVLWGIVVFGGAMDRYVASFWPTGTRWTLIAALALGAVPAMLADAALTDAGHAARGRRLAVRLTFFASLGIAVWLDFDRLFFLLLILPVIALFFVVFGLLGRWTGRQSTATTVGLGLGLVLAWALGVTFPLFSA